MTKNSTLSKPIKLIERKKTIWILCLQGVLFLFGTITLVDLYFAIYEYSEGLADLSWIEILLIVGFFALLKRHYKRCRKRKLSWWEIIRRPLIAVGWFNAIASLCILALLAANIIKFEDIYEIHLMPRALVDELIVFGFLFISCLIGTPKAFQSPWDIAAKTRKAKA